MDAGPHAVIALEPASEIDLAAPGDTVELRAIAGRHDHGLAHLRQPEQLAQRIGQAGRFEHYALAHVDRGSAVIDTDDVKGHQGAGRGNAGILVDEPW